MEKSKDKIKILFIYHSLSSFIETDLKILKKYFEVKPFQWHGKMCLPKMALSILKSDLSISWFASDHAIVAVFLSRIFRKKTVVVTGGNDLIKLPEIGINDNLKSLVSKKFALKYMDLILPFSTDGEKAVKKNTDAHAVERIYLGVDTKKFVPGEEKENIVLTVGGSNRLEFIRKGINTFAQAAKHLPQIKFYHVGQPIDNSLSHYRKVSPPNVKFCGYLSENDLIRCYQRAKVYVQVSAHEGFGLSLAEAMSCECVPVVTNQGAIPEVVGDTGFYVPYNDPQKTAKAIEKALTSNKGKKARERIIKLFPLENREKELVRVIEKTASYKG